MKDFRPIRTALFVPGNRPDRVDKAVKSAADAVIIDLEDTVPRAQKAETRSMVLEKVVAYHERRIMVRVNGLGSGFFERDLDQLIVKELACVMIPKVEDKEQVRRIHRLLLEVERARGLEPGAVAIIPLIESARAVENLFQIVSERPDPPRLLTVAFGAADYTLDMGIEMTKDGTELLYPRSRIPVACRAAGIEPPLDTPFMIDLEDLEALKTDARRAKQLGFQGKLCVHPNQIEPCHEIFSPSREEVLYAEKVIQAFYEAEAKGMAAIQVDGRFVDYPVVEKAKRVLEMTRGPRGS